MVFHRLLVVQDLSRGIFAFGLSSRPGSEEGIGLGLAYDAHCHDGRGHVDVELGANQQPDGCREACVGLEDLRGLLLDDKGTLDQGVQKHGETLAQLRKDVHCHFVGGKVQSLLDQLQLTDLLAVKPNDLCQILAPAAGCNNLSANQKYDFTCVIGTRHVPFLDLVQVVCKGSSVSRELLIPLPLVKLLIQYTELNLEH